MDPTASLDVLEKGRPLASAGIKTLDRPVQSVVTILHMLSRLSSNNVELNSAFKCSIHKNKSQ